MKKFLSLLICLPAWSLDLSSLDPYEDYLESGKKLMDLKYGFNSLERPGKQKNILVGVHGADSRGFEWIYPLQTIDDIETRTYFYRWDTSGCPQKSAASFRKDLLNLIKDSDIEKITLIGHSYGGILLSFLNIGWEGPKIEVHIVASPLGSKDLKRYCGFTHPKVKGENIDYYQWRTRQELDNAFKDLDYDPQIIDFPGSEVVNLPTRYNGRRLGHLWSLSWVAENL